MTLTIYYTYRKQDFTIENIFLHSINTTASYQKREMNQATSLIKLNIPNNTSDLE